MQNIIKKKYEHINFSIKQNIKKNNFDKYNIYYNSLPKININEIKLNTSLANYNIDYPFFINAITCGDNRLNEINYKFQEISKKHKILFMSGSISPILKLISNKKNLNKNEIKNIIKNYVFGDCINVGLDKNPEIILELAEIIKPKFLQLHLNLIQEYCMGEDIIDINKWNKNLNFYIKYSNIPIILKETGFGMHKDVVYDNYNKGIKIFDISGKGGTNFAKIENDRKNYNFKNKYFEKIGYQTADILENLQPLILNKDYNDLEIISSGGIRNSLDIFKSISLGAKLVGISNVFLKILVNDGITALDKEIQKWKDDLYFLFMISNSKNINETRGKLIKWEN